jgi:hypothetical protein
VAEPLYRRAVRMAVPVNIRYRAYMRLLNTSGLSEVYCRLRRPMNEVRVTRHTDVLIDGAPRSGNTFVRLAIQAANPEMSVASHLHVPYGVLKANSWGVPVLVLIRDPGDAAASLVQVIRGLSVSTALRHWLHYYGTLRESDFRGYVADFERVTTDLAGVIAQFNLHTGCHVKAPQQTQLLENLTPEIDRRAVLYPQGGTARTVTSRPSGDRQAAAEILASLDFRERRLLEQARAIYEVFRDVALRFNGPSL